MTRQDLVQLGPGMRPPAPVVTRLREAHHMVALLFAYGLRAKEVAERTGYSLNRVITLEADPSVRELIVAKREAIVQEKIADEYTETFAWQRHLHTRFLRQITERLDRAEEMDEPIPMREALMGAADLADRIGFSKHTIQTNVKMDFAERLDRAINRSGKIIDGAPPSRLPSIPAAVREDQVPPASPRASEQRPPILRRV